MEIKMRSPLKMQIGGDHYRNMKPQPIEISTNSKLGFVEGNILKYICRFPFKGKPREDLQKVHHYSQFLTLSPITNGILDKAMIERFCSDNKMNDIQSNLLLAFVEYLTNPTDETIKCIMLQSNLAIKELNNSNQ